MRHFDRLRRMLAEGLAAVCLFAAVCPSEAAEESRKFLEGVRELGYYDVALEYLEQARTNPMVDPDFKAVIDYEAGATLIASSRTARGTSAREKLLDEAQAKFNKFLAENPNHAFAPGASTQLANLLVERGRIKVEQAAKPELPAAEKTQLTDEARKLYEDAQKVFVELEARFLAEHQKYPKFIDKSDTKQIEARDQVRRNLLDARLALATVIYEIAKTYDPGSAKNKENLEAAAKRYNDLFDKYGAMLAGLYARMWEGRCYKELNDTKKAYEAFEDLLTQPDEPQPFRDMKNKTLILLLETSLLPSEKKYDKALEKAKAWEGTARGREETSPDGLTIKYLAGTAALEYAQSLKKQEDAKKKQDALNEARKYLRFVSDRAGDYQKDARAKLRLPEFGEARELGSPTNFAEARDRAKESLDRMEVTGLDEADVAAARNDAIKYYRMALRMKTPEVTTDDVNVIRYYLTYLYWMSDDLYEAALVGEFLARRYPASSGARQGAKIAMAAWATLVAKTPEGEDCQFETKRMVDIAEYITTCWKGEPEADEAWTMLIRAALIADQVDKARELVENIPPESPGRGDAELMVGQALWAHYLKAMQLPEGQRPAAAALAEMQSQAGAALSSGVGHAKKAVEGGAPITYTLVASVLSLAQLHIGAGEMEKAVPWLEDENVGVLTLVAKNDPATDRGNFRVETYKAALRAYVAVQQLDKAEQVMKALEASVGGDAEAGRKLTQVYISLGRQLEELLRQLQAENKTDEAAKVTRGFELFLDRIAGRAEGNTFNSLNWTAETYLSLGNSKVPSEAESYYRKAADTYQQILKRCEDDKQFAPQPGAAVAITIRLAGCHRRLGETAEALGLLSTLLKASNALVDAQVEAAYAYQALGEKQPTAYKFAIMGSQKHEEIWGWAKIAARVASSPKHMGVFHEARYNLALCRFQWALSMAGKEKTDTLARAENDVSIVERLYPEMGGEEWRPKYDELLKRIQKTRGVKVTGLKPLTTTAPPPAAAKK